MCEFQEPPQSAVVVDLLLTRIYDPRRTKQVAFWGDPAPESCDQVLGCLSAEKKKTKSTHASYHNEILSSGKKTHPVASF